MKSKIKIFIINIIAIFLISLFFSASFRAVNAKEVDTDKITRETYKQLQSLAASAESEDDDFFAFDGKAFMKTASAQFNRDGPIDVGFRTPDEAYNHEEEGGLCYAVKVHDRCQLQHTVAIVDVLGDSEGTVVVYSKEGSSSNIKTTTTKYKNGTGAEKKAVLKAYEAAWYAYKSSDKDEEGGGNGANWKAMLRHWSFVRYIREFEKLGIPVSVLGNSPHLCDVSCGYSSDESVEKREERESNTEDTCKAILNGEKNFSVRARFVLQCAHKYDNPSGHSTGQNRGIFCGVKISNTPRIKITKEDKDTGKKLKGAQFAIYRLDEEENRVETIASGLTTNKNGAVTQEANLIVGATYEIEEIVPPTGYDRNPNTRKIIMENGENSIVFKNEKYSFRISIHKVDSDTGKLLSGATFGIFRYAKYANGSYYKDAAGNYTGVPGSDYPNGAVARNRRWCSSTGKNK